MEKHKRVYAHIDLDAVKENVVNMSKNIDEETKIIGVIKTDAYGHGAIAIARELEEMECMFGFAVATAEEAMELRIAGIQKPILILGYTFPGCYEELIAQDVRITVFRRDTLKELADAVKHLAQKGVYRKALVHIKVDTGMSRIGIMPDEDGLSFVKEAYETEGMEVEGIFTHFARADEIDKTFVNMQLNVFREFVTKAETFTGKRIPIKHCSNSAGIIELPEANMDAVRAGITLYGLWPSDEVRRDVMPLKPVLSLYSHIVFCKEIQPGTAVSYGGTYVADKKVRVATIPVGYGDGYPRALSNIGYVLICGKKAPILGRVCMDQFMVDVTDIPDAKEGERVTLIGSDGEECITMEQLGDLSGRFNYELACDLGKRVPRVFDKDGKFYKDF
ncbi:MAG: alanine racemase [Lachnospiraceae bacterium]|nr:alanine racemase [Lachnospiraceae bacterium]